jgi:hypothetical protein
MTRTRKTLTAAAVAALAAPSAALATDGDRHHHRHHGDHKHAGEHKSQKSHKGHQGKAADRRGHGARHKRKGWKKKHRRAHRAFVLIGVKASGLDVTGGKLAGPVTLDPVAANRKARKVLELTREVLRGEDTIQVGTAGDEVKLKLKGVESAAAIQPADVVKISGTVDRKTGALDIKHIHVKRRG